MVAGAVDGFKEVMQDGQTGYLAIPESVTDLADKLEKLVVSPDLREQMGAAGRKNVMQRFEWDRCVTKMEQVLEKTAQRKGADS
ncbi:MAG TPA: hypothetical protein DEP42_04405 [Ruminococcaceae bacterium]|nr:hypothetical protein [Oscillospiraceae bacterium]